jgi:hypothetical protein
MRWLLAGCGYFSTSDFNHMRIFQADAVPKINTAIQDSSQALSDANILSAMCLATNKYDGVSEKPSKSSPLRTPLRSIQWLDFLAF